MTDKEITVYTFFQPPDGGPVVRADMPIDILDLEEIEGKEDQRGSRPMMDSEIIND